MVLSLIKVHLLRFWDSTHSVIYQDGLASLLNGLIVALKLSLHTFIVNYDTT